MSISKVAVFSKLSLPSVNLSKVFIVINLWIFLFTNFFVLVPVSAYAAPSASVLTITQGEMVYKDVDTYTSKVNVNNSNSSTVNAVSIDGSSVLKNAVVTSNVNKKFKTGDNEISVDIKCGDTVTLSVKVGSTVTKGTLNGPLCSVTNGDKEKPSRIGKDGKDVGDEVYKTYAYKAPTIFSNSTCDNPVGWQADPDNNDEFSSIYFVATDPKTVTTAADISKNPYKYSKVACTTLEKQNYVTGEKDVAVPEVKNTKGEVTQAATTKKQKTVAKIDNTIVQNKAGNYVNKANDFTAEFNQDPSKGWTFKNATDSITITDVKIGGKSLKKGKVEIASNPDKITFVDVLPNIDMEYTVTNGGVSKNIVLKNVKAFDNDLSTIEFTLGNGKNSKIEKVSEKTKLDSKVKKAAVQVNAKTSDVAADIKAEASSLDSAKSTLSQEDQKVVDSQVKELKDLADSVNASVTTTVAAKSAVADKVTTDTATAVAIEKDRIENKPLSNDTIEVGTSTLKLTTPETVVTTKAGNIIKKESFKLENGKLTILPDIKSLKETKDLVYPIKIDPSGQPIYATKDAFTSNSDGNARRGSNNYWALTVGTRGNLAQDSNPANNIYIGDSRTYIRFEMPNDLANGSTVSNTYMQVYQYDQSGGGVNAYVTDYCGKDFDEWNITWNTQGDICGYIDGSWPVMQLINGGWKTSGDLSAITRTYGMNNRYLVFGLYDSQPGSSGDAVFCSKDARSGHICNGAGIGPRLTIVYTTARPSVPDNWTDVNDMVGNCNLTNMTGDCSVGKGFTVKASNFYDGNVPCNANNVGVYSIEASSWNTSTQGKETWNLGANGGGCGGMNYFNIWRFNGTYQNYFSAWNGSGQWAPAWSWYRQYTVDNSSPVRVGAKNTIIPFNKNGSVTVTMPEYTDDSRDVVVVQNDATAGRLDNGAAGNQVYVADNNYNANRSWVVEGNGYIRATRDGMCLMSLGTGNAIYAQSCQDANNFKWEYDADLRVLKSKNYNNYCLEQIGGSLQLQTCTYTQTQKWNIIRATDVPFSTGDSNKAKRYTVQVSKDAAFTQDVRTASADTNPTKTFGGLYEGRWYFRGFVNDRLNGGNISKFVDLGSTYVDNVAPKIPTYNISSSNPRFAGDARISPNNTTSVGLADSLNVNWTVVETNLSSTHLQITNSAGTILRQYDFDQNGRDCINGCNFSQVWDGKDTAGNYVADQKLNVQIVAHDMTARYLDIGTPNQWSNSLTKFIGNATVDNHGANISLSVANGAWTNKANFDVKGALAGYNLNQDPVNAVEDRDVDVNGAWYCIATTQNCNPTNTFSKDINFNFTIPVVLTPGANYLRIKSEDLAYNKRDAIGNPGQRSAAKPDSQVDNWVLNYDNTLPVVSVPVLTKVISPSGVGSDLTFTWTASDTLSGFGLASNFNQRYAMYEVVNGQYVVAHTKYVNTFNCSNANGVVTCTVTMKGVVDSTYKFDTCGTDLATNDSCNTIASFNLKTKTYLTVDSPTEGMPVADAFTQFSGKGEKGANVSISTSSNQLGANNVSFNLDQSQNGLLPIVNQGSGIVDSNRSKLNISCTGLTVDHDGVVGTPNIEYCTYSVYLKNQTGVSWGMIDLTKDQVLSEIIRHYTYDATKMTLAVTPAGQYFSPNGDGKFDNMSFGVKASNSDGSNITTIDKYKLEIKNASGVVVSTQTGVGALPSILYFNGIVNGAWMVDGTYNSVLTVTRTILDVTGDTVVSSPIVAKSKVLSSEKVIIMSPAANTTQIRGGFNISGQAPANWKVDVCISKVATDPDNCVSSTDNDTYKFTGVASAMGYYTVVAEIPDTSTKDYFITSKATLPNTATKTPLSDSVKTTVDLKPNILGIDMVGSLDGVNSDADIAALLAGTKTIDDLKGLVLKIRVTQNTEAIDINFGQYDNVNKDVPSSDYLNQRAGTINEMKDGRGNYIPNQADILRGTTFTSFTQVKDNAYYQGKCMQSECLWTYTIPYPRLTAGGAYELKFTAYKGRDMSGNLLSTVDTRGFVVNGQLPMRVDLMLVAKGTVTYGTNAMLAKYINSVYYTNNLQNTVVIGGEATKAYTVNVLNSANAVVLTQQATTNSNGYATSTLNLPVGTLEGDYRIQVLGNTIGTLRYDKTPPSLTMVKTSDITTYDSQAIQNVFPFVKSGANIKYEYLFSEATDENYMVSANGYVSYATSNGTNYINNLILTGAANGRYSPIIYTRDYAGNMVDFGNDVNTINSIKSIVPAFVNAKVAQASVITPQTVNYDPSQATTFNNLRNANKDFSVIVDGVNPDIASSFDKTGWYDNDGVNADGISPEVDRLKTISVADCQANKTCSFVIRGNTVTLKTKGEKFARGVFEYGLNSVPNTKQYVNPTSSNCTAGTDVISNGVVVKQGSLCDLTYTVTLSSDGSQYDTGEAKNYYQIDFYPVDNAGNIPTPVNNTYKSEIVVVYQDKTGAVAPKSVVISTDSTKPILKGDYTRSNQVKINSNGEMKSDTQYEVYLNSVLQNTRVVKKGTRTDSNGNSLGEVNKYACTDGICNYASIDIERTSSETVFNLTVDGKYTFKIRDVDTAGNLGEWEVQNIIRDTIAPNIAAPSFTKSVIDSRNEKLTINLSNLEIGTNAKIKVNGKAEIYPVNATTLSDTRYIQCGVNNSVSIIFTDKAGNSSVEYLGNVNSQTCPVGVFVPNTTSGSTTPVVNTGAGTLGSYANTVSYKLSDSDTARGMDLYVSKVKECTTDVIGDFRKFNLLTFDARYDYDKMINACDGDKLLSGNYRFQVLSYLIDVVNLYYEGTIGGNPILMFGEVWYSILTNKETIEFILGLVVPVTAGIICGLFTGGLASYACFAGANFLMTLVMKSALDKVYNDKFDIGDNAIESLVDTALALGFVAGMKVIAKGVKYVWNPMTSKFVINTLKILNTDVVELVEQTVKSGTAWYAKIGSQAAVPFTAEMVEEVAVGQTVKKGAQEFVKLSSGQLASKAITPNINASNIDEQAARYLGKTFKIELDGLVKEITIPANWNYVVNKSPTSGVVDGIFFTSPDGSKFIRVMNQVSGAFEYPNGYLKWGDFYLDTRFNELQQRTFDINGVINTTRSLTHFNLFSY